VSLRNIRIWAAMTVIRSAVMDWATVAPEVK
jgi:hypothetical protein